MSQSEEPIDRSRMFYGVKYKGHVVMEITNTVDSTLIRVMDAVIYHRLWDWCDFDKVVYVASNNFSVLVLPLVRWCDMYFFTVSNMHNHRSCFRGWWVRYWNFRNKCIWSQSVIIILNASYSLNDRRCTRLCRKRHQSWRRLYMYICKHFRR